jgi:hypothetical protein
MDNFLSAYISDVANREPSIARVDDVALVSRVEGGSRVWTIFDASPVVVSQPSVLAVKSSAD